MCSVLGAKRGCEGEPSTCLLERRLGDKNTCLLLASVAVRRELAVRAPHHRPLDDVRLEQKVDRGDVREDAYRKVPGRV